MQAVMQPSAPGKNLPFCLVLIFPQDMQITACRKGIAMQSVHYIGSYLLKVHVS